MTAGLLAGLSDQPAGAVDLTTPKGKSIDAAGEATGNPAGFVASWTRILVEPTVDVTFNARQFTPAGKAAGKLLVFDRQPMGLFEPNAIALGGSAVAGFWMRAPEGAIGRLGDTATGKLQAEKQLFPAPADRPAELNMDAVALEGGKFAVVTYRFDFTTGTHKRVAVTLLDKALKVIAGPTMLPGPKASYVATAASDFTVVALRGGGALAVYRNRADGNVYAVTVDAAGRVGSKATRINQLAMPLGVAGQQTEFEVDAARLRNGRIAVAWTRIGSDDADSAFDIRYRVLSATGKPVGPERRAHASGAEEQVSPEVVPLSTGDFVISWTNNGGPVEGRPRSYKVRRFGADGSAAAAERTIYKGERAFNVQVAELVATGDGKPMLIRGYGTVPLKLVGTKITP